jgi:hypothetical protein
MLSLYGILMILIVVTSVFSNINSVSLNTKGRLYWLQVLSKLFQCMLLASRLDFEDFGNLYKSYHRPPVIKYHLLLLENHFYETRYSSWDSSWSTFLSQTLRLVVPVQSDKSTFCTSPVDTARADSNEMTLAVNVTGLPSSISDKSLMFISSVSSLIWSLVTSIFFWKLFYQCSFANKYFQFIIATLLDVAVVHFNCSLVLMKAG